MKIKIDNSAYEERSMAFLQYLREGTLKGISPSQKEDLVFNIACLLDGSANVMFKGKLMIPCLGFQVDDEEDIVFDNGKIVMHELVNPLGEDDFDNDEDEEEICPFCDNPIVEGMKTCDQDECIEKAYLL